MIKKCLLSHIIALTLMTTLLFSCLNITESDAAQAVNTLTNKPVSTSIAIPNDSVLHLIPDNTLGFIYCPNPLELDNKIQGLLTKLSILTGRPIPLPTKAFDTPTKTLLNVLGTQSEILSELEEIGLNLNQDLAILITSLKPLHLSVLAHLTDSEATKEMIEAVTKKDGLTRYKDVPYWYNKEDGKRFAILGNILVFSKQHEVCENVIDTYSGTKQAITQDPHYITHLTNILEDADQLAVHLEVEEAIATLNNPLSEDSESTIVNPDDEDTDKNSILKMITLLLKDKLETDLGFIEQMQSINIGLQVAETDVQIKVFLKLTSDSELLEGLQEVSGELTSLGELPYRVFMNAAFQGSPKLLADISKTWFMSLPADTPEKLARHEALLEEVKPFLESLANQWSVYLYKLGDPSTTVYIYELKDEEKSKAYMDEIFLEKLKDIGVHPRKPIMYNGVEIKNYILPNFKKLYVEDLSGTTDSASSEQHWYYAFTEGQLILSTWHNPELIQMALDSKAGRTEKFSDHPSYQKLVEKLGMNNNIFLAMSPAITSNIRLSNRKKNDSNYAATSLLPLSMLTMALPENYNIGIAIKAKNNGINANLFINVGDLEKLGKAFQ